MDQQVERVGKGRLLIFALHPGWLENAWRPLSPDVSYIRNTGGFGSY